MSENLPRETGDEKLPPGHYRTVYGSIIEADPVDPVAAEVDTKPDEREKAAELPRETAVTPTETVKES